MIFILKPVDYITLFRSTPWSTSVIVCFGQFFWHCRILKTVKHGVWRR